MSEKVRRLLEDMVQRTIPEASFIAKVVSVNTTDFTCEVAPIDGGANYYNVRLKPAVNSSELGLLIIPKADSEVVVGVLNKNTESLFIEVFSEVERVLIQTNAAKIEVLNDGNIVLNDGSNGGLVKVNELKTALLKSNAMLEAIKAVVSIPVLEPGNGAQSALATALNSALTNLSPDDYSAIENQKVKH